MEASNIIDIAKLAVQWIAAPLVVFVWMLHRTQQSQQTEIAVIKAVQSANKEAHDREFKEMRDSFKQVFAKLDTIEQALRK